MGDVVDLLQQILRTEKELSRMCTYQHQQNKIVTASSTVVPVAAALAGCQQGLGPRTEPRSKQLGGEALLWLDLPSFWKNKIIKWIKYRNAKTK